MENAKDSMTSLWEGDQSSGDFILSRNAFFMALTATEQDLTIATVDNIGISG